MAPSNEQHSVTEKTDPLSLGKRLAEARKNARRTQQEVSKELGVSRSAIALIESGARATSSDELHRMAHLYGRTVSSFLVQGPAHSDEDAFTVIGRIAPDILDDLETERMVKRLIRVCQEGALLKRELGFRQQSGPPAYPSDPPSNPGEAAKQGSDAAEQERKRLDLGEAPIADIHGVVAGANIWAASDHLPPDLSGLFFNHSTTGMVVVVNHDHQLVRQRFSYAHEYAHALFDRDLKVTYTARMNSQQLIETRANSFAASFLMPKRGVEFALNRDEKGEPTRHLFSMYDVANETATEAERRTPTGSQRLTPKDVARLALYFNVSFQVACYRLRSLGYVNQGELNGLLDQEHVGRLYMGMLCGAEDAYQAASEASFDRTDADLHIISQLLPLVVEAYQRELVSRGKVLELSKLIGVSGTRVLELARTR